MERSIEFQEEHQIFRETIVRFIKNEIEEEYEKWEKDGIVSRDIWKKFGENGFLLPYQFVCFRVILQRKISC